MVIMVSTLACAVNECRHITPEELQQDNIVNLDKAIAQYNDGFMTFSKAVYNRSIYAGTITDPVDVVRDFFADLKTEKPVSVTENSSSVFVSFRNTDSLRAYMMPLEYKKYI